MPGKKSHSKKPLCAYVTLLQKAVKTRNDNSPRLDETAPNALLVFLMRMIEHYT
jgi:hypothetical protein